MNDMKGLFRFRVNVDEIAAKVRLARELVEDVVVQQVELLSKASHAYIIGLTKEKWKDDDFKRNFYLGTGEFGKDASSRSTNDPHVDQVPKYLRWIKVGDGLWVVEIDERARWLEEGRKETFMGEWLLKPGARGVKRAKDGSLYRAIPFKETSNKKDTASHPALSQIVRDYTKQNKINLTKIEKNLDNTPKLGLIRKLDIRPHDAAGYAPGVIYSRPRTETEAARTGLRPHSGIFKLQGAAVFQNVYDKGKLVTNKRDAAKIAATKKGSVKKETVVFRVISSKHKQENRWMYPAVEPANFLQKAYDHANAQWETIVKNIEETLGQ
jgi:hypothetical protein